MPKYKLIKPKKTIFSPKLRTIMAKSFFSIFVYLIPASFASDFFSQYPFIWKNFVSFIDGIIFNIRHSYSS